MRRLALAIALVAVCTAGPAVPAAGERPATFSDSGPEPQLSRIFREIERNRLDTALEQTESLLRQYPNFRLAHLIKGDLLLARTRPILTLGNAANAPQEKLADLRDEATARLKAYRDKPATTNDVPRYLLQMQPDQKHAIVVDTQKSRLYLYQNDNGRPRFVADYYITHGKLGADKMREGDKKTPVGIYHVTSSLPLKSSVTFTVAARSRSTTLTSGTSGRGAMVTASGCTAHRPTPSRVRPRPPTAASCWLIPISTRWRKICRLA